MKIKKKGSSLNRSSSSSKQKKKKEKFSISKIQSPYPPGEVMSIPHPNTTKNSQQRSRKESIDMRIKAAQMNELSTIQNQIQMMNLDNIIKSPNYQIPRNKVQIKQQYLNKQFIQAKSGMKAKSQEKKARLNQSML